MPIDFYLPGGGLTIDTKSAADALRETAISLDGQHPFTRFDWPNTAQTLREIAILLDQFDNPEGRQRPR